MAHLECSKVDNIVYIRILLEDLVERGLVCDVGLVEGRPLATDELDAVEDFPR